MKTEGALVRLSVGGRPVAAYQTTPSEAPAGVSAHYRHGAYLHPVFTPGGRLVTADYPPDHRHQRGIFLRGRIRSSRGASRISELGQGHRGQGHGGD